MLRFIKRLFGGADLRAHLAKTKRINCYDVIFHIRKIDPLVYMTGAKVLKTTFEKYKPIDKGAQPEPEKKVKVDEVRAHFIDVFMAAVVKPELSRAKDDGKKIFVEYLFTDWALANDLYEKIMLHSYGKKKTKLNT